MWNCPQCKEWIEKPFVTCWRCGTNHRGEKDPYFVLEEHVEVDPGNERPQFSLRSLFLVMTIVGAVVGALIAPQSIQWIFWSVAAVNILGVIAGLIVTHVLRFPNDGSLSWDDQNGND